MEKNKVLSAIIILWMMFGLASCQEAQRYSPKDYLKLVSKEESGLLVERQVGDVRLKLKYFPPALMAYLQYKSNDPAVMKEFKDAEFYQLKIKTGDKTTDLVKYNLKNLDENNIQERQKYLNNSIIDDISMMCSGDTIRPVLCQFEQAYGLSEYSTFLITFLKRENCSPAGRTIIIDTPILGIGPIKFHFDDQHIKKIASKEITL